MKLVTGSSDPVITLVGKAAFQIKSNVSNSQYGRINTMIFRMLLAVSILIASSFICVAAEKLTVEESVLSGDEIKYFKTITKYDKSFHYSKKARRYYRIRPETRSKQLILVELVFEKTKDDQLYFGEFISYNVSFEPDSSIVKYTFDAGTGNRGEGTVMVVPNAVVQTEWSCGVSDCALEVKKNGKVVYKSGRRLTENQTKEGN